MALIALAGTNIAVFEFGTVSSVANWNAGAMPPPAARLAGVLSISCWVLVICFGRLIGFTLEGD